MTWAAFHVIEVIANQKFGAKRVGYLAASQSFSETTDVIMLVTNLIRKVRLAVQKDFHIGQTRNQIIEPESTAPCTHHADFPVDFPSIFDDIGHAWS